jgi:hypothetical protein
MQVQLPSYCITAETVGDPVCSSKQGVVVPVQACMQISLRAMFQHVISVPQ